jgi:hypothetical protein
MRKVQDGEKTTTIPVIGNNSLRRSETNEIGVHFPQDILKAPLRFFKCLMLSNFIHRFM